MARRLLFVNKHPDVIEKFLSAMEGKGMDIDTAENGTEAIELIEKNPYQVVVTGLVMEGHNGEQLISYMNSERPEIVCIIYTTSISAPQLHFFINKRDVFRVFLRPVDFSAEFSEALEEAFEYYDIKVKNLEEDQRRQDKVIERNRHKSDIRQKLGDEESAKLRLAHYMKQLMKFTINEYEADWSKEEKDRLAGFEYGIIELCCGGDVGLSKAEQAAGYLHEVARREPEKR